MSLKEYPQYRSESSGSDGEDTSSTSTRAIPSRKTRSALNSCSKLSLPEHLAAYMEERDLNRDIEPLECSEELVENIFSNYVIVKSILSNLCWQDKLIAKHVCRLWNSAIKRLQKEQLWPIDFCINPCFPAKKKAVKLQKSNEFYAEPLAVFTFCIAMNLNVIGCNIAVPSLCLPPCDRNHSYIDIIYHQATAPKDCMYAVKASTVSYMPLPQTRIQEKPTHRPHKPKGDIPCFCGVYIPKIPGVDFKIVNISNETNIQQDLVPKIKQLTESYIIKGVVACLTDNYLLYTDDERVDYLEFLQSVQPEIPFAFGGCLVEDTANSAYDVSAIVDCINNRTEYVSGNITSLGIFLVPKEDGSSGESSASKHNFEVYSHVLTCKVWSRAAINEDIKEFSKRVARHEHSVALKFSCMGRQNKHEIEQNYFRQYFPTTRMVGCFGNGELGVNHPAKIFQPAGKRARELDQPYEKVHSYSTVFFYIGWGKVVQEAVNGE